MILDSLELALGKAWFFVPACIVAVLFGLGGIVHVANIAGFGGIDDWWRAPRILKVADVVWGILDFAALVGVLVRSPYGVLAIIVAALSQIVAYGFYPEVFALKPGDRAVLRGLVWFHVTVLVVLAAAFYFTIRRSLFPG